MNVLRYWVGASPEAPLKQSEDLETLHAAFAGMGDEVLVEQFGFLGSMILLKVESACELTLDFQMPETVIAFECRQLPG
jgi:hypothetical protein